MPDHRPLRPVRPRSRVRGFAAVFVGLLLLAFQLPAPAAPPVLPRGVLINVGDRYVHLHCTGYGAPVVLLEAGLGGTSLEWTRVQAQVSRFTQVCSYDRAGYGWSDPAPAPRTSAAIARELHDVLARAGVPGPFVLVGHSVGGLHVRVFADLFPDQAAGVVLVDASHEQQVEAFNAPVARLNTAPGRHFVMQSQPVVPANMPSGVETEALRLAATAAAQTTVRRELTALRYNAAQAHAARLPQDIPLVVLTRGRRVWANDAHGDAREAIWMQLQSRLAQLSPNSAHMIAPDSGHHIHLDQPEMVTAAITKTIRRVQARSQGQ